MKLSADQAFEIAEPLLRKHGLNDWTFLIVLQYPWMPLRIKRLMKSAGIPGLLGDCNHDQKIIRLTTACLRKGKACLRRVVLHEIAHALVGPDVPGHGIEWRNMAQKIGFKPLDVLLDQWGEKGYMKVD